MKTFLLKKCSRRNFLKNAAGLCLGVGPASIFLDFRKAEASGNSTATAVKQSESTGSAFEPAYVKLHKTGELKRRAETLWAVLENCCCCPRACGVNRLNGMRGFCRAPGAQLVVSSFHPHFGEERPLVGRGGSGTIFLTHCNLRCVFCQNWEISQLGRGYEKSIDELAVMMLRLQKIGCHNINLVTPTHYSAHILKALDIAAESGCGCRLYTTPVVGNVLRCSSFLTA